MAVLGAAALLGAVACGGEAEESTASDEGDDPEVAAASGGGAAVGGDGDTDTGTGGSEAAVDHTASSLYPMAVGNVWEYEVEEHEVGSCPEGLRSHEFTEEVEIGGKMGLEGTVLCNGELTATMTSDGSTIEQYYAPDARWFTSFQEPLAEGTSWDPFPTLTLSWADAGTVTVPAGTFDSCWERVSSVPSSAQNTYCVGIGLVRQVSVSYTAELSSYTLQP